MIFELTNTGNERSLVIESENGPPNIWANGSWWECYFHFEDKDRTVFVVDSDGFKVSVGGVVSISAGDFKVMR